MTTLGGRICMENKGSCCWSVPVVCALLPGFPSQPTQVQWAAAARRPWGGGEGRAKGGNTIDSPAFYGRNALRTNRFKSRRLLRVHSTLLFPRSKIHRGHAENTLLLFFTEPAGLFLRWEERGSCPKIKGEEES